MLAVAGAVVALAAVAVQLAVDDGDTAGDTTSATVSLTVTGTTATPTQTAATPTGPIDLAPTGGSASTDETAAATLGPFFSAAERLDGQIRAAAQAINGQGPPWESVNLDLADLVTAADMGPVTDAVVAGGPQELLAAQIRILSDLSSRRAAMESFSYTRSADEPQDRDLLAELANGHDGAQRFADDLAAARALADSLPAFTPAAPDTRTEAERQLRVKIVHLANWGCDARGGVLWDGLDPIVWATDHSGTIGHVDFEARQNADGTWHTELLAC